MRLSTVVVVLFGGVASAQPDPLVDGNLKGPEPEVITTKPTLTLPPLPSFDLPAPFPDGAHTPKELRIGGKGYLGREITVRGVVTWAYDCLAEVRKPGMTVKQAQDMIDVDPTLCERAKFYVGDSKTTVADVSLWVVDVPRPYTKLDIKRIKKQERTDPSKCEPDETDATKKICPPYKVGDEVEVTGTFALSSPHSERNSDGLLVYKSMRNVTKRWQSPSWAMAPAFVTSRPPAFAMPALVKPTPVAIAKVRESVRRDSMAATNRATIAYGQRQWETAIQQFEKAVVWKDNHSAWYGLAAAYAQQRNWAKARDAAKHAVDVMPMQAMYRLMLGRALYEAAIASAREDQARRENRRFDEVEVDLSTINFEAAMLQLRHATALDGQLWRPYYLIGSIHRYGGRSKEAAQAFSKSIELGSSEAPSFIALAELYRAWDQPALAVRVSELGTQVLVDPTAQSDLWFELGMAHADQQQADRAIAAFDKALDLVATNYRARFARGQAHFRKGAWAKAKLDLEQFSKLAPSSLPFFQQQAARMLLDIEDKLPKPRR